MKKMLTITSRTTGKEFVIQEVSLRKLILKFAKSREFDEREIFNVKTNGKNFRIKKLAHFLLIAFPIFFVKRKGDFVIFPYTRGKGKLTISVLPFNGKSKKYYLYEYLALIVAKLRNLVKKEPILIFEKYANFASDSGIKVYDHFIENHPEMPVYFLIKKDSSELKNVKSAQRIIYFGSFKHLVFMYAAKLFVSTEGKGHSYFWGERNGLVSRAIKFKKYIFLQHGIIGLKKIDYIFSTKSIYSPNLFVASSQFEKQLIDEHLGYGKSKKKEVIVTGLPRFDDIDIESDKKEYITFFYTWRPWLERISIEKQVQSEYTMHLKKIAHLIGETPNIKIIVHPKLSELMQEEVQEYPHIFVNTLETSIKEVLQKTKLLITDYSSVAWEAYYREVPVLFDMFDQERYEEEVGAYMDLNEVPFGEKIDVLANWEQVINYRLALTPEEKQMKPAYFDFEDKENTARCVEAILNYYHQK